MKRVICVLSVILLLASACALAENEFSGLSFAELLQKQSDLTAAIWASDGWQEVTVPAGTYIVGRDIPAGSWTVRTASKYFSTIWWDYLESNGSFPEYYGNGEVLSVPEFSGVDELVLRVSDGQVIMIEDGAVIFTPYVPAFQFK